MKNKFTLVLESLILLSLMLLLESCKKEELPEKENSRLLNSFSMQVNGQPWEPSQVGKDECMQTFMATWSTLAENPYYTISAYQSSKAPNVEQSENSFRLQITNVKKTGTYYLLGHHHEPHDSYAVFSVKKSDGTYSQYINKKNNTSFVVEVTDLIPISGSSATGIKGTFRGTLYNENNLLDSLTFSKGDFTFNKLNWRNFNQCAQ